MPSFIYQALRAPGETVRGQIQADSAASAALALRRRGYHVLEVSDASVRRARLWGTHGPLRGIRAGDIAAFTRDIGQLTQAGLPLVESLVRVQHAAAKPAMKILAGSLRGQLEDGKPLSESLAAYPALFDPLHVSMVRAGEMGGNLAETLLRLAELAEKRQALRGRVLHALLYPSVILLLGAVTVFVLVSFVAPVFLAVFDDAGQVLPLPTQLLLATANVMQNWWWIIAPVLLATVVVLARCLRTQQGRRIRDGLLLSSPVVGPLVLKNEVVRFAYTLGALLKSDVPMLSALTTVAKTQDNVHFAGQVAQMAARVRDGSSLSAALEKHPLMPSLVAGAAMVGEETGKLPEALQRVTKQCESDLERQLNAFATLLEPLLIVAVGAVVGFIVVAMVLPVFELGSAIQM